MKKIMFLAIIAIMCYIPTFGQTLGTHGQGMGIEPQNTLRYFLPYCFANGRKLIPDNDLGFVVSGASNSQYITPLSAVAQPYFSNQPIKIIGIAAFMTNRQRFVYEKLDCDAEYLQIRQGLENVLEQIRYDTLLLYYVHGSTYPGLISAEYVELYFENPIFLQDTFGVAITLSDNSIISYDSCDVSVMMFEPFPPSLPFPEMHYPGNVFPKVEAGGNWMEIYQTYPYSTYYDPLDSTIIPTLYLFPIIDTAWQPIPANVQTENPVVDTTSKEISLPIRVVEWGEPMLTQIGLVWGKDSNNLYINSANNVPFAMTNQNYYTHHLPADSIDCDTTYYFRAYFRDDMSFSHYGETKSFIYPCDKEDSNSLTNVFNEIPIKLYPNPTDKEITIETAIPMQKVEVINSNGQTIYINEPNKKEVKINTSKFVSGNYITVITTSKGIIKRSFVVK
ncbi:MAG: T9SS type A sorting domain-containing protein [Bacteroidales bacterium]|jgi:hypothetical protein|nr:T9SS type A sorting domain-containing protein [Bacteroidales bacterium]